MAQAFGLPGTGNKRKSSVHYVDGIKMIVKNNSWYGTNVGFDVFIEGKKIYVNTLTREEAAQRAWIKFTNNNSI